MNQTNIEIFDGVLEQIEDIFDDAKAYNRRWLTTEEMDIQLFLCLCELPWGQYMSDLDPYYEACCDVDGNRCDYEYNPV